MRIQELEINEIRGIRHILLKPNCKNYVIWGPNGSGKSAVVDSIDFLLTGEMRRLSGPGTGDLSLSRHGPHIGCSVDKTYVRAKVVLKPGDIPIEISRSLKKSKDLNCDDKYRSILEPILELAKRGHHILTRREILEYITSEGSERADSIQKILNLGEIEKIRKTLVSVHTDFQKTFEFAKRQLQSAQSDVAHTLSLQNFNTELVINKINELRGFWSKEGITSLESQMINKDIHLPQVESGQQSINTTTIQSQINGLLGGFTQNKSWFDFTLRELENKTVICSSNPNLLRDVQTSGFIRQGISFIDDSGNCPLCETAWSAGKLFEFLQKKLAGSLEGKRISEEIDHLIMELTERVERNLLGIEKLSSALHSLHGFEKEIEFLEKWRNNQNQILTNIKATSKTFSFPHYSDEEIKGIFLPEEGEHYLTNISEIITDRFPTKTPEQTTWETLISIETYVKNLQVAQSSFENAKLKLNRSEELLKEFEKARDTVLSTLYDSVSARFADLYRKLHGDDEKNFNAILKPSGPALDFEVDFYGTGNQPPHAMHSEGHQDSMGLCLYLALAEKLTSSNLDLIVLDDVVMSVDSEHRKSLCKVLNEEFPEKQFVITTHDKIWSKQLQHQGVVNSSNLIEFFNWSIAGGPVVCTETDMWHLIRKDLEENNVPGAAAKLRRGSEAYFSEVCEDIQAKVKYKSDAKWELGEMIDAAMTTYNALISHAKVSANSWNDRDTLLRLKEIADVTTQTFANVNIEQWAINPNVHYNNWANFSKEDFEPVVDAFQELYSVFRCNKCGSPLFVSMSGLKPELLRCKCNDVNFNLIPQ